MVMGSDLLMIYLLLKIHVESVLVCMTKFQEYCFQALKSGPQKTIQSKIKKKDYTIQNPK